MTEPYAEQLRAVLTRKVFDDLRRVDNSVSDDWIRFYLTTLLSPLLTKWQEEQAHAQEFKDRLLDALIVNWTYCKAHETDAKLAVDDLIRAEIQMALDPAISKEAAEMVGRAESAERDLAALREAVRWYLYDRSELAWSKLRALLPSPAAEGER